MEINTAVTALGALAHASRLDIFRYLVKVGPSGAAAGALGAHFGLPGATLSFHLNSLKQAALVQCRREGRSLIYSADFEAMGALIGYLLEDCCGGEACLPAAAIPTCQ